MSSFRNHRVVIASLFLPSSAVLGESSPPTPAPTLLAPEALSLPAVALRLADMTMQRAQGPSKTHSRQSSTTGLPLPMKSIVEDLKDKTRHATPAVLSPSVEAANPFSKLTRFAADTVDGAISTLNTSLLAAPRKHQTTRAPDHTAAPRLQRNKSRSTTRRASDDSYRSPMLSLSDIWHIESNPHCNGGLKNAVDSVSDRIHHKLWVGALGTCTDGYSAELRADIDTRMLNQRASVPVWIPDAEFQSCYDEFCHQVLWPCLHYAVPDAPKTKLFYESASFKQYKAVNERFANTIAEHYQEGDMIWVNDYHLLLLPQLLRERLPASTPVGFFMHVAFPSSEIFRCLSVRTELLRGMLGADLVGFQTTNYARHFRQTVSRIMALEAVPKGIVVEEGLDHKGRFVDVSAFPMGIDVKQLQGRRNEPDVAEWVHVLKQRYAGMKIVVGRDKLDEIQGVRQKILAFEAFLVKHPEFQGKVVLIQVALQTTESNELAGSVADVVSRVNSHFSTLTYQPVVFLHTQDLTFSQYLALLTVGDAFIITSLREGMALRAHEWVECQENKHGVLILSEFTGSYSYSGFRSCIAINPWDTRDTAEAIFKALTMGKETAKSWWEELHNHVTTQTAQNFVSTFLNRCVRAHTEHQALDSPDVVPMLDVARLLPRYKHSSRRLILIDLEATLWKRDLSREGLMRLLGAGNLGIGTQVNSINAFPTGNSNVSANGIILVFKPDGTKRYDVGEYDVPKEVQHVLEVLVQDRRNEVWVLSGLPMAVMERAVGGVTKLGLVAENGCFLRTRPNGRSPGGEWINMVANFNMTWKTACLEILSYFTERTPGSVIEERQASMVWRFWTGDTDECADRQWARRQAAEAQNHIFDSLGERYGLRIIPGKNSFLVLPNNISRSTAVGAILHPGGPARSFPSSHPPWMSPDTSEGGHAADLDLILALSSDEKLLRRLNEFDGSETVSTSGKGTDAKWRLEVEDVGEVLGAFGGVSL